MATYRGEVVTRWKSEPGRNDMDIALRYPGAFSDATGQPDANLVPDPNALVVAFEVDDATLAAMQTDAALIILWAEELKTEVP